MIETNERQVLVTTVITVIITATVLINETGEEAYLATHDKCGMPIMSAVTVGNYEAFLSFSFPALPCLLFSKSGIVQILYRSSENLNQLLPSGDLG